MATFFSPIITNAFTQPFVANEALATRTNVVTAVTSFEMPDTANNDIVHVFELPIDAVPTSIQFACDALGAGTVDVGLYRLAGGTTTADATFVALDQDCFATLIAVTNANAVTEILFEAAATNIDKSTSPLWAWAGLSTRPDYGSVFLSLTTPTGTSSVGTVRLKVEYV
jgi:hypothetical protein